MSQAQKESDLLETSDDDDDVSKDSAGKFMWEKKERKK